MRRSNAKIWLGLAAFSVVVLPLGSTGAPDTNPAQAIHASLMDDGHKPGSTVTDLHLIAFSRGLMSH